MAIFESQVKTKEKLKKKTLRKRFPKSALEVKNIANLKHL